MSTEVRDAEDTDLSTAICIVYVWDRTKSAVDLGRQGRRFDV
jgi:hypothetical protein